MSAFLIFPIHLFEDISELQNYDSIYIIEEPRYFTDFSFHKLKLAYHRASMKYYFDYLLEKVEKIKKVEKAKPMKITYINFHELTDDWYVKLSEKYSSIASYQVFDTTLEKKLETK